MAQFVQLPAFDSAFPPWRRNSEAGSNWQRGGAAHDPGSSNLQLLWRPRLCQNSFGMAHCGTAIFKMPQRKTLFGIRILWENHFPQFEPHRRSSETSHQKFTSRRRIRPKTEQDSFEISGIYVSLSAGSNRAAVR